MKKALGLMSGTSADGVSLALAGFSGKRFRLFHYETIPYPASLAARIRRARDLAAPEISALNMLLGKFFAAAAAGFLARHRVPASRVAVIGSHGQTVFHGPRQNPGNTLQIGEPCVIAERTGIPVVADFRMRDVAAGGEGAPLMPFFDRFFFGSGPCRALQNIGGIANVSFVGRSVAFVAFDTGPGNCLIDWAVRKASRGRLSFDDQGRWAARGAVDMRAVKFMAAHPYFRRKPPKSTGPEFFNERWIPRFLLEAPPAILIATLTYLTAHTIRESYRRFAPAEIAEVLVSGGGALNRTLMGHLADLLQPARVISIEQAGLPAQAKEPLAFAFFALRALEGKINHLPEATGARRACILGKIIPGKSPDARR
jgi:anhydro-N-acetylmuramic acid kinase